MARSRPGCRRSIGSGSAKPSGSACAPEAWRCSTRPVAVPCAWPPRKGVPVAEVALERVTRRFGTAVAVDTLDLTVGDGEFVVLLGPTGAGKTTILRLVAGLERADGG